MNKLLATPIKYLPPPTWIPSLSAYRGTINSFILTKWRMFKPTNQCTRYVSFVLESGGPDSLYPGTRRGRIMKNAQKP